MRIIFGRALAGASEKERLLELDNGYSQIVQMSLFHGGPSDGQIKMKRPLSGKWS